MEWNRAQKNLIGFSRESFAGCKLAVVQIDDWGSGLTSVLRAIERQTAGIAARNFVLNGISQWDCVRSLAKKAALPGSGNGCGYFSTIHEAMLRVSQDRKHAVSVWLEEARCMRPAERETIFAQFAYVAEHCDFDVRVVLVIGRVMLWCQEDRVRRAGFPALGNRLLHRAQILRFGKKSCEEIEDTDGLEIAREPVSNLIKTA